MTASTAASRNLLLLGVWSGAIAIAPALPLKAAIALPVIGAAIVWWTMLRPTRWLLLFFLLALLTPPLPIGTGDAGLNLAPLACGLGLLGGVIRIRDWRGPGAGALSLWLAFFVAVLTVSSAIAALYSGAAIGAGSLARTMLFAASVYIFFFALRGPRESPESSLRMTRALFVIALGAAVFACADFYFQFPAPAGFGAQFVWLDEGVFRRAQGLFYEASTLGNFCAFFLVMTIVSFFRPREEAILPRPILAAGALLFATTLILSYSRASVLAVMISCVALVVVRRARICRTLAVSGIAGVGAALAVRAALPAFFNNYWMRLVGSLQYFGSSPNGVLSGRLTAWQTLFDFMVQNPWHTIVGIGYKTLPYSDFAGGHVIADNTWLSLLVETGILGLACFIALNAAILRKAWAAARSNNPRASWYGQWIFCFWAGEVAQMFSGDLITYWRVLPVYFWVLGTALRESGEAS